MFDTYTENQEQGARKSARTVIIAIVATSLVCVLVAGWFLLSDPYERAANQLRPGMSKHEVSEKIGESSRTVGYTREGDPVLLSYEVGGDGPPLLVEFEPGGHLYKVLIPDKGAGSGPGYHGYTECNPPDCKRQSSRE